MILIIGARSSGKREYVKGLGYTDGDIADAVIDERPVVMNLQDIVAQEPSRALDFLPELLKKDAVVCCEVGSGVIPLERSDRDMREATGRLCVALAEKADRVVRLVAGIPVVIKG
ncbi:MAG: bifunctional adenosylcobinamide kinase/adenosylcobinamide-phosphate guanylyltransferase [bacterium]